MGTHYTAGENKVLYDINDKIIDTVIHDTRKIANDAVCNSTNASDETLINKSNATGKYFWSLVDKLYND